MVSRRKTTGGTPALRNLRHPDASERDWSSSYICREKSRIVAGQICREDKNMRICVLSRMIWIALLLGFTGSAAYAQSWEMPSEAQRCPSKWGAKDEVGSGNLMKPEMALKAAKLIHTGEVFSLGFHLSGELPLIQGRRFDLHMKRSTATDPGTRGENEEIVITELGQVGTQLDAFAHQIYGGKYYNCFTDHEMSFSTGDDLAGGGRQGFPYLGVEKIPDIMTRGVLIDVAALKNVDMLSGGYVITAEDFRLRNLNSRSADSLATRAIRSLFLRDANCGPVRD